MCKFVFAIGVVLYSWLHPVHVSLLNVVLDPRTGNIEIAFKLYSDDFENIIVNKYNIDLDITDKADPGEKIDIIHKYIEESFELSINGTKIDNWEFTGNQSDEESIWLYYKKLWPGQIQKVSIRNEILMDLYEDQTNLVIITWFDKQNGFRLNNKTREISFILEQAHEKSHYIGWIHLPFIPGSGNTQSRRGDYTDAGG